MNAAETFVTMRAALRAEVDDIKARLHEFDPSEVGELMERAEKLDAAITTAEQWAGLT